MTTVTEDPSVEAVEDVEAFRQRARTWIRANLKPSDRRSVLGTDGMSTEEELAEQDRQRGLQRMLFDAGFAGIVVPKQYGGAGLTAEHAKVFSDEICDYDYPTMFQIPNMSPCMAVILEFGTEEQKLYHVPRILKGEDIYIQYLSEPSGGSDAAGAQLTAVRDGDEWVLNGSKMWSTFCWRCDFGVALTRTNWDVEKHRGLTVFIVPCKTEGLEVHRIEMADGMSGPGHTCLEYFTDVRIPDAYRIGEVDGGWTVGVRWMFHERTNSTSPYMIHPRRGPQGDSGDELLRLARKSGRISDPVVRDTIGDVRAHGLVAPGAASRVYQGIRTGYLTDQGAALIHLMGKASGVKYSNATMEVTGGGAIAWRDDDADLGQQSLDWISRCTTAGGSIEMARNVISERVLGMPREWSGDRDIAYKDVPRGSTHAKR